MSSELAAWLRRQREDRGWTRTELARQLIRAARARGDTSMPGAGNISHNIYRWERGAVIPAERYKLLYCGAFGIPFSQFGTALPPGMVDTGPAVPAASAYRELLSSDPAPPEGGASVIRREVLMAAHEGSEHAERAEQRGIGEATLEQFRADTASLAVQYLTGDTFGLFTEMRRVRNRVTEALSRRQWPRDAAELYLLAGCLSALMAAAAVNLGYPREAGELTRAGWAYATIIDHRPLMARLRLCAAYAAYWSGQPEAASDLARSGLGFLADGQGAAQLHLFGGLAAARRGDAASARQAIAAARDARDREHHDELLEIGGEFGFSRATQSYYAGFLLSEAARDPKPRDPKPRGSKPRGSKQSGDAAGELEHATRLYAAGPGPGEQHSRRCQMLAHTDLAIARLRAGALDAAIAALEPVLALPPGERTAVQGQRLSAARAELAQPAYRGSAQARGLAEQLAAFAPAELGRLPGQDGVGQGHA
jgi:transcriptional regulator with XRE-family HTH domain